MLRENNIFFGNVFFLNHEVIQQCAWFFLMASRVPQCLTLKLSFVKNLIFFVLVHIGMGKELPSFRGATCFLKKEFVAVIVVKRVSLIAVITIQDKGKFLMQQGQTNSQRMC